MTALRGSCLCGGVRFEITGPLMRSSHCHCRMCQKQHGAAFRSRSRPAPVRTTGEWLLSITPPGSSYQPI